MGIRVSVYKDPMGDFTLGGVSSRVSALTVVNINGPSEPNDDAPAVLLVDGNLPGTKKIVAAELVDDKWVQVRHDDKVGPMSGGNFAAACDSRFSEAIGTHGVAISIHDRYETAVQYAALSQ